MEARRNRLAYLSVFSPACEARSAACAGSVPRYLVLVLSSGEKEASKADHGR